MRDRGKREVEAYNNGDCYGVGVDMPEFPCKKHPSSSSSSSSGICAYCLTDRLYQLVCPECGEQRLSSSCSCSEDFSSNPNSSSTADVGSVGRISFLLENDQKNINNPEIPPQNNNFSKKPTINDSDFDSTTIALKRSNSTCVVDINNSSRRENSTGSGGFWKISKLFRKPKDRKKSYKSNENDAENKSEMAMSECVGVSRSRSLCSFRGFYDSTEESGGFPVSSSAARASSVSANFMLDSAKRSCFSESEARISNFDYDAGFNMGGPKNNNNIFSLKESEFITCSADDPAFIDFKLPDLSSDSKPEQQFQVPVLKRGSFGMSSTREFGFRGGEHHVLGHDNMFRNNHNINNGGSCRISVSERELRKCRKSYKVWKWFFRHQSSSKRKDYEDHGFN